MSRRRLIAVCLLIMTLAAQPLRAAAVWQETKIGKLSYVTLDSFCAFYNFPKTDVSRGSMVNLKGPYGSVGLKPDSREAFINGHRIWLSYPFISDDKGSGYIPRLDVIKLFDPLLRRNETAPRKPVLGVVIDPGHGGSDNGTRSCARYYEKAATLDTAKRLEAILKSKNIPTYMTRTNDVFITLEERCDIANDHKGWIFVSLHYNESDGDADGVETYCLTPQYSASTADGGSMRRGDKEQQVGNKNDSLNLILADYVHKEIIKLHSSDGDRGVKRARFVVLRRNELPSILVEGGFLSSSVDARLITTGAYRQKLAEGVAQGVQNYMALMNSSIGRAPTVIQPVKPQAGAKSTTDKKTPANKAATAQSGTGAKADNNKAAASSSGTTAKPPTVDTSSTTVISSSGTTVYTKPEPIPSDTNAPATSGSTKPDDQPAASANTDSSNNKQNAEATTTEADREDDSPPPADKSEDNKSSATQSGTKATTGSTSSKSKPKTGKPSSTTKKSTGSSSKTTSSSSANN